jgi:hypothetical protein
LPNTSAANAVAILKNMHPEASISQKRERGDWFSTSIRPREPGSDSGITVANGTIYFREINQAYIVLNKMPS